MSGTQPLQVPAHTACLNNVGSVAPQEECTRAMVSAALLRVDHEMTEKQASRFKAAFSVGFRHGLRW